MLGKALAGIAAIAIGGLVSAAQAQDIKLYAFSSGALTLGKGALLNGALDDRTIQVPVGFYVIKHPKGNVLFDTGNNDKIITDPRYWGAAFKALKPVNTPDVAIDVAAAEDRPEAGRHQIRRAEPHASRSWRQRRRSSRSRRSCAEGRDRECVLAEAGHRRSLHDRRRHAAARRPTRTMPNAVKMVQLNGDLDLFGDGTIDREALGRPHAGQPDDDGAAEEQGPDDPDRRQRLLPRERREERPAEHRARLHRRAASSAPTSGSAMRWPRRRRTSSPPTIRTPSRR